MNKQIQKLFQEAYTHFGQGKYFTQEVLAEKFAELLIKDVLFHVKVCTGDRSHSTFDDDDAEYILRDYYGVKE